MPVALLRPADSPRTAGLDREHVARLAETVVPMPPILVRRDMHVVDGMHRLSAAMLRGQATIEVEYFEGSPDDAFLRAVELNVVHGLPLSLADRQAAAKRIMISHPQLSDRAIARTAGLGNKAVAALWCTLSGSLPEVKARLGRDGRLRPVCAAEGRRRAAEVIASNPQASLREVARIAGVAPGTVAMCADAWNGVSHRLPSRPGPLAAAPALVRSPPVTS
ncbi:hypothetical protein QQY66_00255 [Streptomyces sp. DG2A-72]|uniref:ParB/RepB/Spo0J family partition protein n=1 Tax=Streptomyces sp. DG2A-72 TaxID=3051386 RepID=UPI00265B8DD5|nr:hypothetical protein [Streptomyces sp. DG2A-72]MDO0930224.1 hypothetical protein [Streptomyces sp. DG2A-72]